MSDKEVFTNRVCLQQQHLKLAKADATPRDTGTNLRQKHPTLEALSPAPDLHQHQHPPRRAVVTEIGSARADLPI